MSDSSSGRNPATNAGSDSAKHHTGTASQQYGSTPKSGPATPVPTGFHPANTGSTSYQALRREIHVRLCMHVIPRDKWTTPARALEEIFSHEFDARATICRCMKKAAKQLVNRAPAAILKVLTTHWTDVQICCQAVERPSKR